MTFGGVVDLYRLTLPSTINARSDRIAIAPTYREPFKKRRCIVPTTGWYEWQKINAKTKKPFHFRPKAEPFAFAGVYDVWNADGKSSITSFSIVTTDAEHCHVSRPHAVGLG
jgi:putative SOS response-associated peptidase YedK